MNQLRKDCTFCNKKDVNYSCPKCGQFYCSSNCYNSKKHLNCSEQFYKKNVEDELRLRSKELDPNLKKNTLDILKRDYDNLINEDYNDLEELEELKDKFNQLNVQNIDDLWNYLDDNEKQKFNDLLKQNQIINLLPVNCWTPWYLNVKSNLIEELNDKESNKINQNVEFNELDDYELSKDKFIKEIETNLNELNFKIPYLDLKIKKLIDLTKIKPSSNVKYLILNLILSYCYMCRYFNNDHHSFINESFKLINEISLLNQKIIFTSTRQSIQYTIQLLINQKKIKIDFILILIEDLKFIIENNQKIYLNIIADLINLFKQYKKLLKKQKLKNINYKDKINKHNLINNDQLKANQLQEIKSNNQLENDNNESIVTKLNENESIEAELIDNQSITTKLKKNELIKTELKDNQSIATELKDKKLNIESKYNQSIKLNLKNKNIDHELRIVNLLLKKLDYYLSYLNEYRDELLNEIKEIEIERMYLSNFKRSIDDNDKKEIKIY